MIFPPTICEGNTLTAIIPAALLTTAGSANIRVLNPAPAGGYSTSIIFTVTVPATPAPLLGTVNPVTVVADNTAKTLGGK